jgi:CRP-like cAMP-binding protein
MTGSIHEEAIMHCACPLTQDHEAKACQQCPARHWTICHALSDQELALVEGFKSGDRICGVHKDIYQQGDELDELYTVVEGWVCLYKLLEDGRRQITRIALPGDFIGYQADLTRPMEHTAEALTPVRLCVFPRKQFLDFVRSHPELAMRLTWMIATYGELGHDRLLSVGRQSAIERVAHFLLELFYRVRLRDPEPVGASINMPLTQVHIGDALGLTGVHVNRKLGELRKLNLVEVAGQTLQVLDPDGLAEIAGFDEDMLERLLSEQGPYECLSKKAG